MGSSRGSCTTSSGRSTASSPGPTKWGGVEGIRVTPNVYTTLDEIDRFVEAMRGILARG
jgi:selenocysteine lyase/cysteine desulfurase